MSSLNSLSKVVIDFINEKHLLEHTICAVELHLGCKSYKYYEKNEENCQVTEAIVTSFHAVTIQPMKKLVRVGVVR